MGFAHLATWEQKAQAVADDHSAAGDKNKQVTFSGSAGMDQTKLKRRCGEKTYLRKTVLPSLAFVIGHLYDFTDLLNEGLPLTLQDELTLNLKHGA